MILSLMFTIHCVLITPETVGNLTQKLINYFGLAAGRHVQCTLHCQYWQ